MSDDNANLPLPVVSDVMIERLSKRRSNLAKLMQAPGPDGTVVAHILEISARVPDHRKLAPWRFIVFQGDDRATIGPALANAFKAQFPEADSKRVAFEAERFKRAPLVVAVVSSPKDCARGTPKWEQELSAGAVCLNMVLAAQAYGFGAQWLTEWYAYDPSVLAAMGLSESEQIAGFIYIGSVVEPPAERARPVMADITQYGLPPVI